MSRTCTTKPPESKALITGGNDEWGSMVNFGIGLRGDMSGDVFVKALYRLVWVGLERTEEVEVFDGVSVAVGFQFD